MTVIDVHVHVGPSLYGGGLEADDLLKAMDALSVDRSVIIPPKPPGYRFEEVHDKLTHLAALHRDRFVPFCRVDPWQRQGAEKEVRRCLLDRGMAGLFLHPLEENFPVNLPLVDPLIRVAEEASVPVMLAGGHVRVSLAPQIGDLVRRWPDVSFVVTSGGQINVSGVALAEAQTLFQEYPNTWLETSGIYRLDFIEDIAEEIGAERILFGSDAPRYDMALELKRVQWAHRPEQEKALMAGGNASRLLGLESP